MDVVTALGGVMAAFGLSTSAGLNAYIPLLMVALAGRFPTNEPLLTLNAPYDTLTSWWVIGFITVMLIIEMSVDKIPAADTINDLIQTLIRPTAGAVLFAANAQIITDLHPIIAVIAGIVVAGTVHTAKGVIRPAVTATTGGTGNWLVSIIEDVIAFFVSLFSILIPILAILILAIMAFFIYRFARRLRRRKPGPGYS